jgi:hypothetical protein
MVFSQAACSILIIIFDDFTEFILFNTLSSDLVKWNLLIELGKTTFMP